MSVANKLEILKKYWGYTSFNPLQEETIQSVLEDRDSLTMLPTGGGKSLCFQLPALMKDGMAVVISPLISLMKDQVDGLVDMGIAAACLNSTLSTEEYRNVMGAISVGNLKLLYLSPERLQDERTVAFLQSVKVSFFVIDEAHCISHWGHDFRGAYRNLRHLKKMFEGVSVHAFTATATEMVQKDISDELSLENPDLHIGTVDRTNLTYRVYPRLNLSKQVCEILERHHNEAGIIYCLRKKDVDSLAVKLHSLGHKVLPYHAGLRDEERHRNQELFLQEKIDLMVATVAFGMGIDRSNIRFVIHAAMPKSIEHYQQETGRAGRDGLPSFCYMLYGGSDYMTLSSFANDSSNKNEMLDKLGKMYNFCAQPQCRHKVLVKYFNEKYDKESCQACDYCLNELDMIKEPLVVSQKILSCVFRVNRGRDFGFGAGHITDVLLGKMTDKVRDLRHDELSTFAIMKGETISFIRYMTEQLLGQGYLWRNPEFSSLFITKKGWTVLKGDETPKLIKPLLAKKKREVTGKGRLRDKADWRGIDLELFDILRKKRTQLAEEKGVPPYIIFGDKSLKDMAAKKPLTLNGFSLIFGVGERKLADYGHVFLREIKEYLRSKSEE